MLIQISRFVARMIMMLARNLFLSRLIAVPMLIHISRLVSRMIVMRARFVLCHGIPPWLKP
ncbi:hypothetical protein CH341_00075 [Rhodoplanes roseus]|uniref:Uncharacterized protein n=1 Tax=Rhodoplanes roseus TaxID=29409 RepID=A0A327L729_9BRAD|nr:hypothetical protein CH341_00075 [Rhodoplanes roseus]